jgi:hypothetical protein
MSSDGAYYSSKEGSVAPLLVVTTSSGSSDTTKPTPPADLVAAASTASAVDLTWTASTDDVGVVAYDVFRTDVQTAIGSSAATSFSTSVQPGVTYTYYVVARDGAGNVSDPSGTASITTATSSTLTFEPSDDTFVDATRPTASFGSMASLEVDNSPTKQVLLKFTVTGAQGRTVTSAKLRLYCLDPASAGGDFYRLSGSAWSEATVTWNSAPVAIGGSLGALGSVSAGSWYEVDVSSLVTGDDTYGIKITSSSSNGADYSSKEGAFAPKLVVSFA